eukprot:scaffold7207_cov62-Phaeocystis_antarctica.AAC.10
MAAALTTESSRSSIAAGSRHRRPPRVAAGTPPDEWSGGQPGTPPAGRGRAARQSKRCQDGAFACRPRGNAISLQVAA